MDSDRDRAERERLERERLDRERAERERRETALRTLAQPIYFDFDKSGLAEASRLKLDAKLAVLSPDPGIRIRIEGHADDRGSGEYNLALGHRRAASVRNYLVTRGIATSRIEITSFGEERPACLEPGENCWHLNRRAEFVVDAGRNQ